MLSIFEFRHRMRVATSASRRFPGTGSGGRRDALRFHFVCALRDTTPNSVAPRYATKFSTVPSGCPRPLYPILPDASSISGASDTE